MSVPLVILALGSIFVGYCFKDAFIGLGTPFFSQAIFVLPYNAENTISAEFLSPLIKFTPVIFSLMGALLAFIGYGFLKPIWSAEGSARYEAAHGQRFAGHNGARPRRVLLLCLSGPCRAFRTLYTFLNNK